MNERSWSPKSFGATRIVLCVAGALALLLAITHGCTSSSDDAAPSEDASAETQTAMPQEEAGAVTPKEAGVVATDTGHPATPDHDGGSPSADAGTDAKGASKDAAATSDACAAYCACYEKKCTVFVPIPTGQDCPDFCATFEKNKTQYDCRFNMCFYNSNGPAQNNNNHCQHAAGIDECL